MEESQQDLVEALRRAEAQMAEAQRAFEHASHLLTHVRDSVGWDPNLLEVQPFPDSPFELVTEASENPLDVPHPMSSEHYVDAPFDDPFDCLEPPAPTAPFEGMQGEDIDYYDFSGLGCDPFFPEEDPLAIDQLRVKGTNESDSVGSLDLDDVAPEPRESDGKEAKDDTRGKGAAKGLFSKDPTANGGVVEKKFGDDGVYWSRYHPHQPAKGDKQNSQQ